MANAAPKPVGFAELETFTSGPASAGLVGKAPPTAFDGSEASVSSLLVQAVVQAGPESSKFPCKSAVSVGRALRSQCRGRGFDSLRLHWIKPCWESFPARLLLLEYTVVCVCACSTLSAFLIDLRASAKFVSVCRPRKALKVAQGDGQYSQRCDRVAFVMPVEQMWIGTRMIGGLRQLLCVLLIAVLASGALSTPALRHSHAINESGAANHSHAHGHGHSHHHHGNSHHHSVQRESRSLNPEVEHFHLSVLGFELTLPIPAPDAPHQPDLPGLWIAPIGDVPVPEAAYAFEYPPAVNFDSWQLALNGVGLEGTRLFVPSRNRLLSEAARGERSGVLRT